MAVQGAKDGRPAGNYPELLNALTEHGAQAKSYAHALYAESFSMC